LSTPAAPRRLPAWWGVLWPGMAALVAVMGVSRFVYTPILPEMLVSGVLTLREAGWVAAANFLGYLAGAMAASAIHGRRHQAWLARAGLGVSVASLAAMALLDGTATWMAVRFAAGVASAFALVFVSTQVLERLTALGEGDRTIWLYSGVGIGIAGSALTTLGVQAAGFGWQVSWAAAAALAAVCAAAAWCGAGASVPGRPESAASGASDTGAASVASRASGEPVAPAAAAAAAAPMAFAATVAAYGLFGLGYVIHATYLPAMVRAAGYSADAAIWIWVLVGLVALPSIVLWRAVARRHGVRAAIVGCYLLGGLTALVPLFGESIAGAAIAGVGLGATFIATSGLALPRARALDPARSARAIGVMTAAFGVGQIVGPVAAAYLAEGAGFGGPSVLACVVLLSAAALMAPRLDARR
jgi:MFS family permease